MPVHVLYTATATSTGDGRQGRTATDDGRIDLGLAHPRALGGDGEGSNPEQLFAAGYAACFHSAVKFVGRERKLDVSGTTVTAAVGIGPAGDEPGFELTVDLTVALPSVPVARRRELLDAAHGMCPYSRATRGNIDVRLRLADDEARAAAPEAVA
jgi:Ohr subfamily peroxiredoxin